MSAASLDTSDPEIFIAIPRSACINQVLIPRKGSEIKGTTFFNAGESFTPSPVLLTKILVSPKMFMIVRHTLQQCDQGLVHV